MFYFYQRNIISENIYVFKKMNVFTSFELIDKNSQIVIGTLIIKL